MRTSRTPAALALLLVVGATLTACGDGEQQEDRPRGTTAPPTSPADPDSSSDGGNAPQTGTDVGEVDLVSVVQAAQERVAGGSVVSVEWEDDAAQQGWEVTLVAAGQGVELLLAPDDLSEVARRDTRLDRDEAQAPELTAEEAVSIASAEVPGVAEGLSLGTERGSVVWDVEVRGSEGLWEVHLDAASGEVVHRERED